MNPSQQNPNQANNTPPSGGIGLPQPQNPQPQQQNNTRPVDGIIQPQPNAQQSQNTRQQATQPAYPPQPSQNQQQNSGKTAQQPKANPNSTQNHLQIAEIRDGIVIMNDGSFRSVIMAKSINFDLMSPAEREGVELGFQNFLNSLYFPVQIFVRSEKVDLGPYIDKLDKIRIEHDNMLLSLLMEDYISYIDQLAAQTNIMDKHFYVVVPFFPKQQRAVTSNRGFFDSIMSVFSNTSTHVVINENALNDAKTELKNRVQAVLGGLNECGVKGLPLDTQELIELYYDSYNPDTATRQELKDFSQLSTPVVTKGEGQARQPDLEKELPQ